MSSLYEWARRAFCFAVLVVFSLGSVVQVAGAQGSSRDGVGDYAGVLRAFNARFSLAQARDMAEHVLLLSSYYSLDPRLLIAIVGVESGWRPSAVSPAGAQGLGQLMPETANGLEVRTFAAYENLDGTARYLRRLLDQYASLSAQARYEHALAGYNAGPEAVARYGGIPPYRQTREYVVRVMALWDRLRSTLSGGSGTAVMVARAAPPVALPAPRVARALPAAPHPALPRPAATVAAVPSQPSRIVKIAITVPKWVADGSPIPVTLKVRGSGHVRLVARVGPTIVDKHWISSSVRRIVLRALPRLGRTRLVQLRATAPGVPATVATVFTVPLP